MQEPLRDIQEDFQAAELALDRGHSKSAKKYLKSAAQGLDRILEQAAADSGPSEELSSSLYHSGVITLSLYPNIRETISRFLTLSEENLGKALRTSLPDLKHVLFFLDSSSKYLAKPRVSRVLPVLEWLLIGVVLLITCTAFTSLSIRAFKSPRARAPAITQSTYAETLEKNKEAPLWVEFGKKEKEISWITGEHQFKVAVSGFIIGSKWPINEKDTVTWDLRAKEQATIMVRFPDDMAHPTDHSPPYMLALYLIDDASALRNIRIQTPLTDTVAGNLHPGKWVFLPLTLRQAKEQSVLGRYLPYSIWKFWISQLRPLSLAFENRINKKFTVKLRSLTGGGTAVSAMALMPAPGQVPEPEPVLPEKAK